MKTNNNLIFKPILFSTPMVQAILRNEKTQTRRILKEKMPVINQFNWPDINFKNIYENIWKVFSGTQGFNPSFKCNYKIGDILWVRETWQHTKCLNINFEDENYGYVYKADGQPWEDYEEWTWKPSIFMPKDACRIFLKITKIRIERLKNISESDAIAEGIVMNNKPHDGWYWMENIYSTDCPVLAYERLWQKINGENSWEENPFVFVYEFERTSTSFNSI